MKIAQVYVHDIAAGILEEQDETTYLFTYFPDYVGPPVSLTMPTTKKEYQFNQFPPFFEGLLPEGVLLEALLRKYKLDKHDYFEQLTCVGHDLVGAISIEKQL